MTDSWLEPDWGAAGPRAGGCCRVSSTVAGFLLMLGCCSPSTGCSRPPLPADGISFDVKDGGGGGRGAGIAARPFREAAWIWCRLSRSEWVTRGRRVADEAQLLADGFLVVVVVGIWRCIKRRRFRCAS